MITKRLLSLHPTRPLQSVTVTLAASTNSSAASALMTKVHHLGPEKEST
jgi:hypothetical protein